MRTAHLFAGAGGGLLADIILGHEPRFALEINDECCSILRSCDWWPELEVFQRDITEFDATEWKGRVDSIHAGVPCPRWSTARRGAGDPGNLWPHVCRVVSQARPAFVFIECVPGFAREHETVKSDLARIGYGLSEPLVSDAAHLGAPHTRERYWALGYANDQGEPVRPLNAEVAIVPPVDAGDWWNSDPRNLRVDDGVAGRSHRYKAIGNGQVPLQAAAAWLMLGGPFGQMTDKEGEA